MSPPAPSALPHAPSTLRNRAPILRVLRDVFADARQVLEIGSGSGEHAVHFATALPHLAWQPSERAEHLPGLAARVADAALPNLAAPLALDALGAWPTTRHDAAFTANTLHIMPWQAVEALFAALPGVLTRHAVVAIYGAFHYGGRPTSESNAAFDAWLRQQAPHQGIRDIEAVLALAERAGLALSADIAMPSNNRCLVLRKQAVGER